MSDTRAAAGEQPPAWVFDVDGCLVDSQTGRSLRPMAADLLATVRGAGRAVVLWSAGGEAHARNVAERLGVATLVDAYYDKAMRGADRCWSIDHLAVAHRPEVFVDDRPEEIPVGTATLAVHPYIGPDVYDVGLRAVLAAARALPGPAAAAPASTPPDP